MAKKRFEMTGTVWQYVGLALLAVLTLGVVAYALMPATTPAVSAAPTAKPSVTPTVAQKPKVVAFIGDSYTAGSGTSSPALRWSTRLSVAEGLTEVNLGRGGSGYLITNTAPDGTVRPNYRTMIAEAVKASPDVVFVSGGGNDLGMQLDPVLAATRDFYPALRAALPDATIVAVNPLWGATVAPAGLAPLSEAVREAVAGVGGTFLDIGQPLIDHPELVIADKVHPNDQGAGVIADAVRTALRKSPAHPAVSRTAG